MIFNSILFFYVCERQLNLSIFIHKNLVKTRISTYYTRHFNDFLFLFFAGLRTNRIYRWRFLSTFSCLWQIGTLCQTFGQHSNVVCWKTHVYLQRPVGHWTWIWTEINARWQVRRKTNFSQLFAQWSINNKSHSEIWLFYFRGAKINETLYSIKSKQWRILF